MATIKIDTKPKHKKIIFNDEGEVVDGNDLSSGSAHKSKNIKIKKKLKNKNTIKSNNDSTGVKADENTKSDHSKTKGSTEKGEIDTNTKKKTIFNDEGEIVVEKDLSSGSAHKSKNIKIMKKIKNKNTIKSNNYSTGLKADENTKSDHSKTKESTEKGEIDTNTKNKKIIFNDEGEIVDEKDLSSGSAHKSKNIKIKKKLKNKNTIKSNNDSTGFEAEKDEIDKKWYEMYSEYNKTTEIVELKEQEEMELRRQCRTAFEGLKSYFVKKNPSDAHWLNTALKTGTAKDKYNAGALLVSSNPLANLETLGTLNNYSKLSNKSGPDAITIITELFMDSLLPSDRKLISHKLRGESWRFMKKQTDLNKDNTQKILAYWHFENELKDHYFEYLKNLQHSAQAGQDNNKNSSIIAASKLLSYSPEKEQLLLSMLINKLGDPSNKVASKALHHLTEVAHQHPNMCGVITNETEKLLFRNNISDHAQHFALCYLAQIAPSGRPDVCTKLVNICFALFKVLVKKGAINNKTMQAILRCLQKSITEAIPPAGSTEIINKEMQDTIYRLVHLADIHISIQTLSLLLQLITSRSNENTDRFYNALYCKLLDLNLVGIGNKIMAQFLHIVHKAIHIDSNLPRASAFIKRLLQLSLYMPANFASGCLIIVSKLLKTRHELFKFQEESEELLKNGTVVNDDMLSKFDSDGEEKYEDVKIDKNNYENELIEDIKPDNLNEFAKDISKVKGWHHANIEKPTEEDTKKFSEVTATKYNPYHRVPAYAGAEFSIKTELLLLQEHFHPTVTVFAESIINSSRINYYGDPLKDFSLSHFLERFSFKNPKKLTEKDTAAERSVTKQIHNKFYKAYGGRGMNVKSLTKLNCTEDEMFIFEYLEKKRDSAVSNKKPTDDEDVEDVEDVDDDEFNEYLDSLCKKSSKSKLEDDLDYMNEFETDFKNDKTKNKKKKASEESDDEDNDDWSDDGLNEGDDASNDEDGNFMGDNTNEFEDNGSDGGSISLDEDNDNDDNDSESENDDDDEEDLDVDDEEAEDDDDDDDEDNDDEDELDEDEPKSKKSKTINHKSFNKVLKGKTDMSSLFAAADDFSELLEETSKSKGHGTLNAVFNKDKSSDKQLKWEEKRRNTLNNFGRKRKFKNANNSRKYAKKK